VRHCILTALIALFLFSCTGKEPEQTAQTVRTDKSLFDELKEQTVKNPGDADAWFHLADFYERSQLYKEEVDALLKVIAIDPGHNYAYVKIGAAYSRLAQYQQAIHYFEIAVRRQPSNPVLRNNLGVAYGKLGKIAEEIASLQKAISIRPNYSTAHFNLGITYLKQGRKELAEKEYRELAKFDVTAAESLKKEIESRRK